MKAILLFTLATLSLLNVSPLQSSAAGSVLHGARDTTATLGEGPVMLLRLDDFGMSHGKNKAIKQVIETGMPVSVSVMFACPWWKEAVEILRMHPEVSVGVHLTLNAEWAHYRWGPVLGRSAVPSLVDDEGYFFPSRAALFGNDPDLGEIEAELRAQIRRAVDTGLQIDYVDYHMGAAVQTPETRAIVEKLAAEFGVGISRWFGEDYSNVTYHARIESKTDSLVHRVDHLDPDAVNLQVIHVAPAQSDMDAMIDLNPFGPKDMARQRHGELNAVLSPEFRSALSRNNVRLITYRDLIRERGLDAMRRPEVYR